MADEKQTTNTPKTPATPASGSAPSRGARSPFPPRGGAGRGGPRSGGKDGGRRPGGPRGERAKPEFEQKSLEVRRVARVVAGGRRFSFSVAMVIGDRKGRVGVGTGKATDVSSAMDKAMKDAKKAMITVKTTKTNSLPHEVEAKYSSARVVIYPAPQRGLVAGSAIRNVLELAGITDVSAKVHSGSKNKLNMARATVKALATARTRNLNNTN